MNIREISQILDEVTSLARSILRDIIIDQEDNPENHKNKAREVLRTLQDAIGLLIQDV